MLSCNVGVRLFGRGVLRALFILLLASPLPGGAQAEVSPPAAKFGAWDLQCASPPGAKGPVCALTQTVRSEEMASASVIVAFRKSPAIPNGVLQIMAPQSVFLLEGIKVKIDQDDIGAIPFFRCTQIGCAAEAPLGEDVVKKLASGRNLLITIYINPGEGLRNIVPLEGFKDGYKALQ
ncbi:invasion associated locus B family protein [Methylocystis parvus]|nr:invasion associated locus B family protein [Methylocystis parvus]WBK01259.1 invasion associated locus B family protein [Methylocystis parvus OBBP]